MRKEGRRRHANWSEAAQMVILIPGWICAAANLVFFLAVFYCFFKLVLLGIEGSRGRIAHRWEVAVCRALIFCSDGVWYRWLYKYQQGRDQANLRWRRLL
ncbi:hypothetical protein J3F84DRAFT_215876 [Trichoderma pleuroticola]